MGCILRFGWQTSFVLLGIGSLLVMLPLTIWMLRDDPESLGLEPDGVPAASAEPGSMTSVIECTAVAEALQVPSFWLLTAGSSTAGSP